MDAWKEPNTIDINFDRSAMVYFSGEEISGAVVVKPKKAKRLRAAGLRLELYGEVASPKEAETGRTITEKERIKDQRRQRKLPKHLRKPEAAKDDPIYEDDLWLAGAGRSRGVDDDQWKKGEKRLERIWHGRDAEFRFSFRLPRDAPSSTVPSGLAGYDEPSAGNAWPFLRVIRWRLTLSVVGEEKDGGGGGPVVTVAHRYIHVNRTLDLNWAKPAGPAPVREQVTSDRHPLQLQVSLPATKLVCGDELVVRVKADHRSGGGTATVVCRLHTQIGKVASDGYWEPAALGPPVEVAAGASAEFQRAATVPPLPPTSPCAPGGAPAAEQETLVSHWLTVEADVAGWCCSWVPCCSANVCAEAAGHLRIPLTIGNVPLEGRTLPPCSPDRKHVLSCTSQTRCQSTWSPWWRSCPTSGQTWPGSTRISPT